MRPGVAFALLLVIGASTASAQGYYGKELGPLTELHHAVKGRVYVVDARTLFLKDFVYDGEGPAAYFYVGASKSPTNRGAIRLRDERGGTGPLRRYRGEGITLTLPDGHTLKDVKWFSVWCDEFSVNFGDVSIPRDLEYPKPAKVGALHGVHGVSSDPVVVVDAQTLLVPNFSYDGEAPDAKFWVGRGDKPSPQGIRIPDENGKEAPLRKYDKKTVVLTLPGELTVFDIGHFGVWCEAFTVNFGHVTLPRAQLANVPPSLKMLGVSPQSRNKALMGSPPATRATPRRPIQRLDATTYRPPRLSTGPLAALLDAPADHPASLHRRADNYSPPKQQLVEVQPSKELYYKEDGQEQKVQNQEIYQQDQRDYFDQRQKNYQSNDELENQRQYYQRLQEQKQLLQQQLYQIQDHQRAPENYYRQQYYQPQQFNHPDQIYQQQYEQELHQRRLYEQQLLDDRYRQLHQQEPFQYRLVPYNQAVRNYRDTREGNEERVDLDLVRGSGAQ